MTGGEEGFWHPGCVRVCVCVCVSVCVCETCTRMGLLMGSLLVDVTGDSQVIME